MGKLARLFEMPEREFEDRVRGLEEQELFRRLVELGVVSTSPYEKARFAARRLAGRELRAGDHGHGLSEALDGNGELVALISRIGQERFEEFFLGDAPLSDEERARVAELLGISQSGKGDRE